MNTKRISAIVLALIIFAGCRSLPISPNADRNWVNDFQLADKLVITSHGVNQEITDPTVLKRLAGIYSNAKFETYWHTLTATLGRQTIEIYSGDTKLRKMSYTGVLWEHSKELADRTAKLTDQDRQWLESLFDSIGPGPIEIGG